MSNNPEEAHQNTYQYIMRKIDMYGEPLQWYIGSNETYQTVAGGFRTFLVFSITFIYLVYLIIMLFKDRSGSFVMYDISYSELDDAEFKYYEHFEIFFYFKLLFLFLGMKKLPENIIENFENLMKLMMMRILILYF